MSSVRLFIYCTAVILAVLWAGQARAPKFGASADISIAPGDQELLDRVGTWPDFDAYVDHDVITFPLARGGDLLELFRIADATGDRTLSHVSPVIRAYSAFHLMRTRPERAQKLARLLDDDAPVTRTDFGETVGKTRVRDVVLDLLCKRQDETQIRQLLRKTARDLKRLASWTKIRACLDDAAG